MEQNVLETHSSLACASHTSQTCMSCNKTELVFIFDTDIVMNYA